MLKSKSIVALSLIAVGAIANAQVPVTLRYNPTAGRTYKLSSVLSMSSGAVGSANTFKFEVVAALQIDAVTPASIKLMMTVPYYHMDSNMPGQSMEPMMAQLKKMKLEAVIDHLGNAVSQKVVGTGTANEMSGMFNGFGMSLIGIMLPKAPVAVGGTWEQNVDMSKMMGGAAQSMKFSSEKPLKVSYVLKKFDTLASRKVALVEWKMEGVLKMTSPSTSGTPDATPQPQTGLSFSGFGHAAVDVLTGMNITSDSAVTVGFNVGAPAGSGSGAPGQMTQTISSRTSLLEPSKL